LVGNCRVDWGWWLLQISFKSFLYIFLAVRVCWPLLCFCLPFRIFERCLDSNSESCCTKQALYQLSHPSPYLATHLLTLLSYPSPSKVTSPCKNVSAGDVREERKGGTPSGGIGSRYPLHPHLFVLLDPNPHFKKNFLTRTKQLRT